jgi:hypothetical protein
VLEFYLEFITMVECTLEVEKIRSENFLYRPWNNRLVLSNEARSYKKEITESCLSCGFHKVLTEICEKESKLVIKADYDFNIPVAKFFTKAGDLHKCDVTNMLKAVEDSILGEIIDDRYVVESTIRKNPVEDEGYSIHAVFNLFRYRLVRE